MTVVIARDATATDHLVYAWPFPLGPEEIEISCGEDEIVVMCPSWLVGDRLGPGRHRWRTPDPTRPVGAYFVSIAPVETSFDVTTSFVIPATQQTATLRAQGSIIVRCVDPGLLIAQFVGLPFDDVNAGLLRSVTRSAERLIARVLTRRTVMAQTVVAVTDPGMLQSIIDEMIAYNPAAGAVFGVEFMRLTGLYVSTGDLGWTTSQLEVSASSGDWASGPNGSVDAQGSQPRWKPGPPDGKEPSRAIDGRSSGIVSGEIGAPPSAPTAPIPREEPTSPGLTPVKPGPALVPPPPEPEKVDKLRSTMSGAAVPPPARPSSNPGGGTNLNPTPSTPPPIPRSSATTQPPPLGAPAAVAGSGPPPPIPMPSITSVTPPAAATAALGARADESGRKNRATLPSVSPPPGLSPSLAAIMPRPVEKPGEAAGETGGKPKQPATPSDGAPLPVMGIGMGGIGVGRVGEGAAPTRAASEPKPKPDDGPEQLEKGAQVRVHGPDGRLVAATLKQELSGYCELEIGGSGEVMWVPRASVVTEK